MCVCVCVCVCVFRQVLEDTGDAATQNVDRVKRENVRVAERLRKKRAAMFASWCMMFTVRLDFRVGNHQAAGCYVSLVLYFEVLNYIGNEGGLPPLLYPLGTSPDT